MRTAARKCGTPVGPRRPVAAAVVLTERMKVGRGDLGGGPGLTR